MELWIFASVFYMYPFCQLFLKNLNTQAIKHIVNFKDQKMAQMTFESTNINIFCKLFLKIMIVQ